MKRDRSTISPDISPPPSPRHTRAGDVQDAQDAILYLLGREVVLPDAFQQCQPHVTEYMRAILVDWLVEVCEEFHICPSAMYLGISILDEYMTQVPLRKNNLQLVGATCMFIASKMQETHPCEAADMVYISDNIFSVEDVAWYECQILKKLDYRLFHATRFSFLFHYLAALGVKTNVAIHDWRPSGDSVSNWLCALASYFLDLTLLSASLWTVPPSHVARAVLRLVQRISLSVDQVDQADQADLVSVRDRVKNQDWDATIGSPDTQPECDALVHQIILDYCGTATPFKANRQKYARMRYSKVSSTAGLYQQLLKLK